MFARAAVGVGLNRAMLVTKASNQEVSDGRQAQQPVQACCSLVTRFLISGQELSFHGSDRHVETWLCGSPTDSGPLIVRKIP
jgi:hypothetical protein